MLGDYEVMANLPAVDLGRAKEFYEDKLGLKCIKEDEYQITLEAANDTKINLYKRAPTKADHTAAAFFGIEDLEDLVSDLRNSGVVFEEYDMPGLKTVNGIATMGDIKAAWFKDSEGNIICIGTEMF
ncbi:VOC family protein [Candidatus Giovannonibacteria bacterium]|nr:VOC family protein [Candidatus Giovannonibacteria bacterium]